MSESTPEFITDSLKSGPPLEIAHAYYHQWPTGIAVSATGRMFSNFPGGLDPANVNNGTNNVYTVGELISMTEEKAYPSIEMNSPPGGAINYTTNPPSGANYPNHLIGVQSVVVDPADRLWILDTGRVLLPDGSGTLVPATYGGPKLVGVNLKNDTVFQTILFPIDIAFPDSYINDVRFDLRENITATGKGVAYITDSSAEGRNGIIVVDLGTGESWRRLSLTKSVLAESQFLPFVWGEPVYNRPSPKGAVGYLTMGADAIAISNDSETLYWGPIGSRYLYSAPTRVLYSNPDSKDTESEMNAQQGVVSHGQKGVSDGMETDTNGIVYMGSMEQNAIVSFDPTQGTVQTFVRDPRINWVDTMSIATDGYLYFTCNQLNWGPSSWPGGDRRVRPFALFKAVLPNDGTKIGYDGRDLEDQ
ncbi:major royal jelly protein [Apodospora peruviana]|uniref:Major royal jelly protein n=1 Tax=Apodospora peruviana TaxID=516989 RepID=A0AAE0IV24_9PEZI|nr:major royal jelly protein [Apodospora peruviana]